MKEYRTNEELIDYLESKGVSIPNKKDAIDKIERYTYYSIVNSFLLNTFLKYWNARLEWETGTPLCIIENKWIF